LEEARLALQRQLDSQKTQKQRNTLGQFATPTGLASQILAYAKTLIPPTERISFLDPAIGTGSFYSALKHHFEDERISKAEGFEIDPHYAEPSVNFWHSSGLRMRVADFTIAEAPLGADKPNLIICNPPYVRHHHLDSSAKARLGERAAVSVGIAVSGLAGLYCYFMAIAHTWLADDGLAGWLIPSEFMDVNYGGFVRKYLTDCVELIRLHRFDPTELQFGDAQVSSVVVWFRKRRPSPSHVAELTYGGDLFTPLHARSVPVEELRASDKWSGLAQGLRREDSKLRLSDLFQIKRGLATGDNKFFVLSEEQAFDLRLPRRYLRPVLPSPRYLASDTVDSDAEGLPLLTPRRLLVDCNLSEEELPQASPELAEYFQKGRKRALETYLCSRRTPWYSQEQRPPAPIVCTYMGRGLESRERPFRFILNRSKATALNVYLMLYPTMRLREAMILDPSLIERIWRSLNQTPPSVLLGEGRVYGGGLYKMEPKELANLPIDQMLISLGEHKSMAETQRELFPRLVA
jgi:hypothetical protein